MTWPIHGVHEQDVLCAIVVVVQDTHATAHRLRKVFLSKSTAMVTKGNTRRGGGIDKTNRARRPLRGCTGNQDPEETQGKSATYRTFRHARPGDGHGASPSTFPEAWPSVPPGRGRRRGRRPPGGGAVPSRARPQQTPSRTGRSSSARSSWDR